MVAGDNRPCRLGRESDRGGAACNWFKALPGQVLAEDRRFLTEDHSFCALTGAIAVPAESDGSPSNATETRTGDIIVERNATNEKVSPSRDTRSGCIDRACWTMVGGLRRKQRMCADSLQPIRVRRAAEATRLVGCSDYGVWFDVRCQSRWYVHHLLYLSKRVPGNSRFGAESGDMAVIVGLYIE